MGDKSDAVQAVLDLPNEDFEDALVVLLRSAKKKFREDLAWALGCPNVSHHNCDHMEVP